MNISKSFVICSVAVAPLRKDASDASEMVSQMLLGESARILEQRDRWIYVETDYDAYSGWIGVAQCITVDEKNYNKWNDDESVIRSPFKEFQIKNIDGNCIRVPFGARIVFTKKGLVRLPFGVYESIGELENLQGITPLETAHTLLGVPYMWGGRSESGIDCSGFVQLVMMMHHYDLPRDSQQQAAAYEMHSSNLVDAIPGDIIYFSDNNNRIYHLGFYLGNGLLLHASGQVKIENIDSTKREETPFTFNERLSGAISGIQRLPVITPSSEKEMF